MAKDPSIERPRFDVFGTLLILTFLMTLGACLILNDDLTSHWGYKGILGDPPKDQQKWHLTEYRDLTKKYDNPSYVDVRKVDLDEWKAINTVDGKVAPFPVTGLPDGPADYKVNEFPEIDTNRNTWSKDRTQHQGIRQRSRPTPRSGSISSKHWFRALKTTRRQLRLRNPEGKTRTPKAPDVAKAPDCSKHRMRPRHPTHRRPMWKRRTRISVIDNVFVLN